MGIKPLLQNKVIALIVAVYGGFALVLIGYGLFPGGTQAQAGESAHFSVENLYEEEDRISLKKFEGKHVLVYFFSSW